MKKFLKIYLFLAVLLSTWSYFSTGYAGLASWQLSDKTALQKTYKITTNKIISAQAIGGAIIIGFMIVSGVRC